MVGLRGAANPPWVVLVEDDQALQQHLAGALEGALPEIRVRRTPDAEDALRLVRDRRSRLLITEAQSASVDGLSLALRARKQRPLLPLIFIAEAKRNLDTECFAALGQSHLVDKPPELDAFVGLVARELEEPAGFRGELATNGLLELVQVVLLTTRTGALHVQSSQTLGTLWFSDGELVHAVVGRERGAKAFRRMLRWHSGRFRVDPAARPPKCTIRSSTTELLLESARLLDEEGRRAPGCSIGVPADVDSERSEPTHSDYADTLPDW